MTEVTQRVRRRTARVMRGLRLGLRVRTAPAAEQRFLKHQGALTQACHAHPRRYQHVHRLLLVWLSYWFNWLPALTIVQPKPKMFKRWRRRRWRLLWKTPSRRGRPPMPPELRALIRQMARENLTWGQQRIAHERRLKLGLQVSPRTVRAYVPGGCNRGPSPRMRGQRRRTFMRNHAAGLLRSDLSTVFSRRGPVLPTRVIEFLHAGRTGSRQGNGGERRRARLPRCSSDVRPDRGTWKTRCPPRMCLGSPSEVGRPWGPPSSALA
jgi:hypothetical protein